MIGFSFDVTNHSDGNASAPIELSAQAIDSDAAPGQAVGAFSVAGGDPGWSFTLLDNASGRFAVSGNSLHVGATTLSHVIDPLAQVTVQATKGLRTITRIMTIAVRQPLPKTSASLTFVSNRVAFPLAVNTVNATDCSGLGHTYHVAPEYGIAGGMRLLFCNFYIDQAGPNYPERVPGNSKAIDFVTVFVGGTPYPVTFAGAESVTLADGAFIWSDVVMNGPAELGMPARQAYFIRVSETVAAGAKR